MSSSRFVRIDGLRMRVETSGRGSPLLLLHGFTGSARAMAPLGARLARRFRVIAPDLVGHGETDAPEEAEAYSLERCSRALVGLLDALDAAPAHLLGYSMGGRAALHFCVHHPERARSAVLIGASAGIAEAQAREARRRSDAALADAILRDGVAAFVEAWSRQPLFASQQRRLSESQRDALRAQRMGNRAIGLANSLRGMGAGAQEPLHQALAGVGVPLLLLAGRDDPKFQEIARDLASRLPGAELAWISRAGHAAHLENPSDVVSRAIRHFQAHDAPAPSRGLQALSGTRSRCEEEETRW